MIRLLLACAALLALTFPASAQGDETRVYFRDALAACRADGYCSATFYVNPNPPSGIVADNVLRIGRAAEGTDWEISFTPVAILPARDTDVTVNVDGESQIRFDGGETASAFVSINDIFLTGPGAQTLLDAMRGGKRARFTFAGEDSQNHTVTFSLSGLVASMTWMAEQQDRLGETFIAGAEPAGLAPAYERQVMGGPTQDIVDIHRAQPECDALADLPHGDDYIAAALDEDTVLYGMPCFAGAYNLGYKFYADTGYGIEPLAFAEFSDTLGWHGTTTLINPSFDEQTGTLVTFSKGRGLGDCGSSGTWSWAEYGFRLDEYAYKADCDGEPGDFPVIYRFGDVPQPSATRR